MNISELEKTSLVDLRRTAKEFEIPSGARMKKEDLILRLLQANAERQGLELRGGILESGSCGRIITSPARTTSTSRNPRSGASACAPAIW
jgi:transcription termination factor Rho